MPYLTKHLAAVFALLLGILPFGTSAKAAEKLEDSLVIATTGGLMETTLEKFFYAPFAEKFDVEIVPFAVEVPDQWARIEGMKRSGNYEFDVVTATDPDLISHQDELMKLDCDALTNIKKYGTEEACQPYGVARTMGGMIIVYNTKTFPNGGPKDWKDFYDVKKFPGPRGLPDTGDRDWWVPATALLADGVPADKLFPLDLDRAYRKLDEIRPSVRVWWKTGDQSQQIMRSGEVVMQMMYSGRALQVVKEGHPAAMVWGGAIRDLGYMAILKNAKSPKAALAYVDFFYANYEKHPDFMRTLNYGTLSTKALDMLKPEERKLYATYPENFKQLVKPDYKWIGDNRAMLRDRWTSWLTK